MTVSDSFYIMIMNNEDSKTNLKTSVMTSFLMLSYACTGGYKVIPKAKGNIVLET